MKAKKRNKPVVRLFGNDGGTVAGGGLRMLDRRKQALSVMLAEVDGCPQVQGGDSMESIAETRWLALPELEQWIFDGIITGAALPAIFIYLQKITIL